jgi:hypothetical protein
VLVVAPDAPLLIDFELARMPGHAHGGGTPATAAPELRWLPDPRLHDRRSDVYSLGLMLRWLLHDGPRAVVGEALIGALCDPPIVGHGGVDAWLTAMVHPRRSARPAALDGLLAAMSGQPDLPVVAELTLPRAASGALDALSEDVDDAVLTAVRTDLIELVALDGLSHGVPEDQWRRWAQDLARAHSLRAHGAAPFEVAKLELASGHPWRVIADSGAPLADLALRVGAPDSARRVLGPAASHVGQPVYLAIAAAAEAELGAVAIAAKTMSEALKAGRPLDAASAEVYWRALTRVLYATGSLSDIPRIVLALPQGERGIVLSALTPALGDLARQTESERRRLASRADRLRGLVSIALGATVLQLGLLLGELCMWRVAARHTDNRVLSELADAARLVSLTSPEATGPILGAVAAHQRGDAPAVDAALAEALDRGTELPPLTLDANIAAWARQALTQEGAKAPAPSWADDAVDDAQIIADLGGEDDASAPAAPPAELGPLAILASHGVDEAIRQLEFDLANHPRSARSWTVALQIWSTVSRDEPEVFRHEIDVLLDALQEAGMPRITLLPWRMQACALAGDPRGALRVFASQARNFPPSWPAWLLATRSWADLRDVDRASECLDSLVMSDAPDGVVHLARQAVEWAAREE